MPSLSKIASIHLGLPLFLLSAAFAGVGGSISGTVKDPSGAAMAHVSVALLNTSDGVRQSAVTDGTGTYSFPVLPVGSYVLEVNQPGFRPYRRTGIMLDANSALLLDLVLQVGPWIDIVTVSDTAAHIETSSSQMGEVISSSTMTGVPLNGRSYTDLLALQSGVAPATSITSSTVQDVGASAFSPSGDLNPGTVSINGQREFANSFMVNGSDVEEDVNMGSAIIPNLDSIAEFRIITNNFDAEYGEYSGGQINVITKSGTNAFHGDLFEFLRNTDLDARNYFSPTRGSFNQNQFGGTLGGPVTSNKIFFYADYQGTRQTQGVDTGLIPVPSAADRSGDLSDLASSLATASFVTINGVQQQVTIPTTTGSSTAWAGQLTNQFGYAVTPQEPYYFTQGETQPIPASGTCRAQAARRIPLHASVPRNVFSQVQPFSRVNGPLRRSICCNTSPPQTFPATSLQLPSTTRRSMTTKARFASMPTRTGDFSRLTISSTTSRKTILILPRKAEPMSPASAPQISAAPSC